VILEMIIFLNLFYTLNRACAGIFRKSFQDFPISVNH